MWILETFGKYRYCILLRKDQQNGTGNLGFWFAFVTDSLCYLGEVALPLRLNFLIHEMRIILPMSDLSSSEESYYFS